MGIICKESEINNIMLTGLSLSGKTYFLYRHLKNFIGSQSNVKTKTTYYSGPNKLAIWDLPGKENMRLFWPLFYRNINFSGLIYIINYQQKETFLDSIKVLHDLLNSFENKNLHALILMNVDYQNLEGSLLQGNQINNSIINDQVSNIESDLLVEEKEENKDLLYKKLVKKLQHEIYFHLLPQHNKQLAVFDVFNQNNTNEQVTDLRNIIINFIKNFD